jgi:hypothetical protein
MMIRRRTELKLLVPFLFDCCFWEADFMLGLLAFYNRVWTKVFLEALTRGMRKAYTILVGKPE